ncbi:MAG: hypothetical protein P1S60_01090 [Anaerolineae bacterium]|nr:hypothetical protein [Anaerolineae bacterium]
MREYGEKWGGGFGVVGPAFPRGAPQFEEVSQTDGAHESQHRCSVIARSDDNQKACHGCQDGQRVTHCRPDEGQHGGEENGEDNPVKCYPELTRVFGQRDAQEADDPVDSEIGDKLRRQYPKWELHRCNIATSGYVFP